MNFSSLENEYVQSAKEHLELVSCVLSIFEKSLSNVIALKADNWAIKCALSQLSICQFIGFASYRYNLSVKQNIDGQHDIFKNIKFIMSELSFPVQPAKLRKDTELTPVKCVPTQPSSNKSVPQRHIQIEKHLSKLNILDIDV